MNIVTNSCKNKQKLINLLQYILRGHDIICNLLIASLSNTDFTWPIRS